MKTLTLIAIIFIVLNVILQLFIFYKKRKVSRTEQMPKEVFNDIMKGECKCSNPCTEYCASKNKFQSRL